MKKEKLKKTVQACGSAARGSKSKFARVPVKSVTIITLKIRNWKAQNWNHGKKRTVPSQICKDCDFF